MYVQYVECYALHLRSSLYVFDLQLHILLIHSKIHRLNDSPGVHQSQADAHLVSSSLLMYICTCDFVVSSSVSDAQVTTITPEDATNPTYSITVNCTINPDSTADMCEVMATANGQILTGNEVYITHYN